MTDGKAISYHGGNVEKDATTERNKTGGKSVGVTTRRRRFWKVKCMYDYNTGANSPYDCGMVSGQPAARLGGGA
jgi:hypothetical protein